MATQNENTGTTAVNLKQAHDQAKNERIKKEKGTDKIDPQDANREENLNHKSDVSEKRSGGGHQNNIGD